LKLYIICDKNSTYAEQHKNSYRRNKKGDRLMAFEKFTSRGRSFKPRVSIWKRGQIGLTQAAVDKFNLFENQYVVAFYDKDVQKIGLKFTSNKQEEGAAKMNVKSTGAIFSAKAFLDYYEIDYTKTKRYDIDFDKEAELYVFNLKTE